MHSRGFHDITMFSVNMFFAKKETIQIYVVDRFVWISHKKRLLKNEFLLTLIQLQIKNFLQS